MSRQELKLRAATFNNDPKKVVDAFSQQLGIEGPPPGSHISSLKRSLVAQSGSWTFHQALTVTFIDMIRSIFHSHICKLGQD
jgi:hypothetical protein